MRLVNTKTFKFEDFEPAHAPPYAALSHRWNDKEWTYRSVEAALNAGGTRPSYNKLLKGCEFAASEGYDYFWIDTCCIDKTNQVELSEAINSMFIWYREAGLCLAYLEDVPPHTEFRDPDMAFSKSEWFERGWTLQELIAPSKVVFLASDWSRVTSKEESPELLATITGIPRAYLLGEDLEDASVAMRMSWASRRITTKAEDIAYCLLGIFDIQMPLLYGEGEAGAFRRLQQQILQDSDDQSIFSWAGTDESMPRVTQRRAFSLLAPSPKFFKHCHDIVEADPPIVEGYVEGIRAPTVFNNKGLHLSLPTLTDASVIGDAKDEKLFLAILACSHSGKEETRRLAIWLRDISANGGRCIRVDRHKVEDLSMVQIGDFAKYSSITVTRGKDDGFVQPMDEVQPQLKTNPPKSRNWRLSPYAIPITLPMSLPLRRARLARRDDVLPLHRPGLGLEFDDEP